jgi:purine-binding chemotaxis protein CheW
MSSGNEIQVVTLSLGREVFAVPVEYVREILEYRAPFVLPDGPSWLMGLIDVRGRGTPVIDLRVKLGLAKVPADDHTRIMVLDVPLGGKQLALGFVADKVREVVSFTRDQFEPAPDVGVPWRSDYIAGVVRHRDDFVVLFELEKLITAADAAELRDPAVEAA